jgi:carbamoylphosphate synthase large subunit
VRHKILLLGNHRHTVTVVRSLGRAGFGVILGQDEHDVIAQHSRYCAETWAHPKLEENEREFGLALEEFVARRPDVSLVFPIGESMLVYVTQNAARFPTLKIVAPALSTVFKCLDKKRSYDTASKVGIPVPTWRLAGSVEDLHKTAREIGYPCIVKPNRSNHYFFGKKAIVCRSSADLSRSFRSWPEGKERLIVQRYVESDRPNCHFRAIEGRLVDYYEHVVIRTDQIDQTGFEIDGISVAPTPILRDYCSALIRALNYSGVGCVQFLTDRSKGKAYFLEINPRLDATCALPYAAGVDFPLYAVECLLPDRIPESVSTIAYPAGVRIHYLMGDIQGLVRGLEDRSVSLPTALRWIYRMGKSSLSANVHLTFQWNDPGPTVRLYGNLLKVFRRRLRKQPANSEKARSERPTWAA